MTTATNSDLLNLRSAPDTSSQVLQVLPINTTLTVLDTQGEWLHVQTPHGEIGYVSAAFVTLSDTAAAPAQAAPVDQPIAAQSTAQPSPVVAQVNPVTATAVAPANAVSVVNGVALVATPPGQTLNVRSSPDTTSVPDNKIAQISTGTALIALEDAATVASKLGTTADQNLWLYVQLPDGMTGYVAARFVSAPAATTQPAAPVQPAAQPAAPVQAPAAPVQTSAAPAVQTGTPAALPGDLDQYFAFMATQTNTPPIPQGFYDFQALSSTIGLPAPFDMLPTQQTTASIRGSLIVNGFGPNNFAQQNWSSWYSHTDGMHNGLDHVVPTGTPLLAVADGIIVGTEQNWKFLGSNDKCITLWPFLPPQFVDANGHRLLSNVLVAYAHLSNNSIVQRHQVVKAGDTIGLSGYPGTQTDNAHLHLEVHLLTGDQHLPVMNVGRPLADYPNPQPFGAISPFNPLLFFSERMVKLHLRVGMKGNGGMSSYPAPFDFFSVGQYEYAPGLIIWNHLGQAWPNGIFDLPTLIERAKSYTPFTGFQPTW